MAKVVLINPPSQFLISDRDQPPMGILSIAATVRSAGHEVAFVDLAGVPEECWFIPEGDFYGITATTPQYPTALRIIDKLRYRNGKIILGGYHASADTMRVLRESGANYVVVGEGELVTLEIITESPDDGIKRGDIQDVTTLPMPAWDMLDIHDYAKMGTDSWLGPTPSGRNKVGYVQTARGCPYNCNFCGQMLITQRRVRELPMDMVMEYMWWWFNTAKVGRFYMFDDAFTVRKDRVVEFCKRVVKEFNRDIDWHCLSTTKDISGDLFDTMVWAGCKGITYGTESLADGVLSRVEKFMTAAKNMHAINLAVEHGLKVRSQMIVGLPGETWETVRETARRLRDLPDGVVVGVHTLVPLPGSTIWRNLKDSGFSSINPETVDFSKFTTIGRPGEDQTPLHDNALEVIEWREYLLDAVKDRNIAVYAQRRLHK